MGEMGVCGEILGSVLKADNSQNKLLVAAGSADVNSGLIVQREKDDSVD